MSELVPARSLELLASARQAIEKANTVDEVKELRDRAEAIRVYAKQAGESLVIQNECAEVKLRAERKAGELLSAAPKQDGGHAARSHRATEVAPPKLADLGVDKSQSSRWQAVARVPEPVFEAHLNETKASGNELTTIGVLRLAKTLDRQDRTALKRKRTDALAAVEAPRVLDAYTVLCADPPWRYDANATPDLRSIENHYPTMTLEDIKALPVPAADDSVLFLWATSPKLTEALDVMAAWDFGYRTCMVWVKDRIGMGYYARQQHELLLIGKRGNLRVPDPEDRPASVITAPRVEHSTKPAEAYAAIERMYPDQPRVELFARGARPGWAVWGNQAQEAA